VGASKVKGSFKALPIRLLNPGVFSSELIVVKLGAAPIAVISEEPSLNGLVEPHPVKKETTMKEIARNLSAFIFFITHCFI
jgi:hypothetical protein